MLQKWTSITKW